MEGLKNNGLEIFSIPRAGEMAQQIKLLVSEPADLSAIPRTQMAEG